MLISKIQTVYSSQEKKFNLPLNSSKNQKQVIKKIPGNQYWFLWKNKKKSPNFWFVDFMLDSDAKTGF